ncbi:VOC family protein [Micrococcus luteus]|nr:VOC family protein [Micrococcus luteus]
MSAVGTLTQLVIECSDARALGSFWQEVLDLEPPTVDGAWVTFGWEPVGRLSFHEVPGYTPPPWPGSRGEQHTHFDHLVEDFEAACARVAAAGACALSEVQDPGPKAWQVFADPQGRPFCLVSVPE